MTELFYLLIFAQFQLNVCLQLDRLMNELTRVYHFGHDQDSKIIARQFGHVKVVLQNAPFLLPKNSHANDKIEFVSGEDILPGNCGTFDKTIYRFTQLQDTHGSNLAGKFTLLFKCILYKSFSCSATQCGR